MLIKSELIIWSHERCPQDFTKNYKAAKMCNKCGVSIYLSKCMFYHLVNKNNHYYGTVCKGCLPELLKRINAPEDVGVRARVLGKAKFSCTKGGCHPLNLILSWRWDYKRKEEEKKCIT